MRILGNIVWMILGGILIFLYYCLGCIVLCITIIGIPFGIQCFKMATLALMPFGKEVKNEEKSTGAIPTIMNVLWLLFFGVEIAIVHLFFALIFVITIIGIPFAKQHMKLAALALTPFGKEIIKIT
ncbi:MAG: YccF domain-containing protein [Candidatus Omnitrophota bacterium]